jgi:hypothetical protein
MRNCISHFLIVADIEELVFIPCFLLQEAEQECTHRDSCPKWCAKFIISYLVSTKDLFIVC